MMTHKRIAAIARLAAEFAYEAHCDFEIVAPTPAMARDFLTILWDMENDVDSEALTAAWDPQWWLYFSKVYDRTIENLQRDAALAAIRSVKA